MFTKGQSGTGPQPMDSPETAPKMKGSPYLWRGQVSGLNCACPHTGAPGNLGQRPQHREEQGTSALLPFISAFWVTPVVLVTEHLMQSSAQPPGATSSCGIESVMAFMKVLVNGGEAQSRETGCDFMKSQERVGPRGSCACHYSGLEPFTTHGP